MNNYHKVYSPDLAVLMQLAGGPVHDGDLVSKDQRDRLHLHGLCCKAAFGWNLLTVAGAEICDVLRIIRS